MRLLSFLFALFFLLVIVSASSAQVRVRTFGNSFARGVGFGLGVNAVTPGFGFSPFLRQRAFFAAPVATYAATTVVQAPVLQAPIYQAPILQAPVLAPVVQAPVYQAPILQAPSCTTTGGCVSGGIGQQFFLPPLRSRLY